MTERDTTHNSPDNRLWAVLFIAVGILVTAFLRQLGSESVESAVGPRMVLHDSGGKLEWLPEEGGIHNAGPPAVVADFTPFFFAPIPVNSAGRDVLTTLPGIGPAMAERIIEFRTVNGPITGAEAFMRIPGIGRKRLESLQPYISFQ